MNKSDIHIILSRLDVFIRKFYFNEFIKGLIIFILIAIFYFSAISCAEYFAFFPTQVRTVVFFASIVIAIISLIKYVIIPLFHFYNIGRVLSYVEAAKIITKFFPEIKDTLLNTLELANDSSLADNQLAIAAINQKIALLHPIPFTSAINLKKLIGYWKYFATVIIVIILISIFYPHAITDGAKRIVKHNEYFEKPAPFTFILDIDSLSVIKGADFSILMHTEGKFAPEQVEISIAGTKFFMSQKTPSSFEYTIHGCNNSIDFYFLADEVVSQTYNLQVFPLPQLLQFTITAVAPQYTQFKNFTVANTGDITIPAGTHITWNVKTTDTDSLLLIPEDGNKVYFENEKSYLSLKQYITRTFPYTLIAKNAFLDSVNLINYTFTVIPDVRPSIQVEQKQDSSQFFTYYFKGNIQDDYGFSSLDFVYFHNDNEAESVHVPLEFTPNVSQQQFFYMFDFSQFSKGEIIKYYFEVSDNDEVNGKKYARTSIYNFTVPSQEELDKTVEKYSERIETSLSQSSSLSQELIKDFNNLKQKLLNENISEWERKQLIDEMQQKQEQLKQQVKDIEQSLQQKNDLQNKMTEQDEEILRKQQEIEELLNTLMDDELRKMMEEFNQMMEKFNKDDFMKKSEDMKMSLDNLSEQLDRDLELLKRMEVEEQLQNTTDRLRDLAEKQQKLAEEFKQSKQSEELQQKIEDIANELKSIEDNYNKAQEKNEELQQKYNLQDYNQQFQDIQKSIKDSESEQNKKQGSKSMNKASEQTKDLAEKMEQMMQQQMSQQNMEDMNNLRQILENLMTFSFKQENLMVQTGKLSYADPKYAEIAEQQNALGENFEIIKDSLYALSLRVPQISQPINNEVVSIYKNGNQVIDYLEQRQRGMAKVTQQYMMTSSNNLALMLSEVLSSMQEQAAMQMEGQQQCQNPKNSGKGQKSSLQQMQQMQQSLKNQMQQMMQQMKNGSVPSQSMQKQLSEMLMKEQMLKQLGNNMLKDGGLSPEGTKQLKDIQRLMDAAERDIINQNITPQTFMRQEQILTRLLEAENAERERDTDKKRESTEAVINPSESAKKAFKQTEGNKIQYDDVLQDNAIKLNSQYLKIFMDYLSNVNENN